MSLFYKQVLSYVITFAVYVLIMPWPTALVVMGGIAFHEHGHLWAAKKMGFENKGFFLIPFMGGVALSQGVTKRYSQKAFIAIMGPVAGALLSFVIYLVYLATGIPFIGQAAFWMAFLNLFNLAPLSFLDGGQLLESVVYSFNETLGLVVMAISTLVAIPILWYFNPVIAIMIAIFGGLSIHKDYKRWKMIQLGYGDALAPRPKAMDWKEISMTIGSTISLSAALAVLMMLLSNDSINLYSMFKK